MKEPISQLLAQKAGPVYTIGPDDLVFRAVHRMNVAAIGSLPVVSKGRLVGIFTERDVLVRVIDGGRDAARTRVANVMTPDPICVTPTASVADTMLLVTENHCRHLPVVEDNELIGVISIGDLIRWAVRNQNDRLDGMLRAMRVVAPRA